MEIEIIDSYGNKSQLSSEYCGQQPELQEAECSTGKKSGKLSCVEGSLCSGYCKVGQEDKLTLL